MTLLNLGVCPRNFIPRPLKNIYTNVLETQIFNLIKMKFSSEKQWQYVLVAKRELFLGFYIAVSVFLCALFRLNN